MLIVFKIKLSLCFTVYKFICRIESLIIVEWQTITIKIMMMAIEQ